MWSTLTALALLTSSPADPETPRYGLVSSGGVSQGAYQAGVTYALIERFRGADPARPERRLEVATGASAGNINSVLAVITACSAPVPLDDPTYQHALANPFFDAWINVGWDKLVPAADDRDPQTYRRLFSSELGTPAFVARAAAYASAPATGDDVYTPEDGVLARSAAFAVAEAHVIELLRAGRYVPGCGARAGVTLTPTFARQVQLGGLWIRNQRTLVAFNMVAPPSGAGLAVGHLDPRDDRWQPLFDRLNLEGHIAPRLLRLMKAGSAFPVAFAPMDLHQDLVGGDPRAHRYADGGVFDNVPLGLADQLRVAPPAGYFYYSDPDARRGQPRWRPRPTNAQDTSSAGVGTFIGETRRHEIQTALLDSKDVLVLDRFHPITAGEATAFGAFAHRDFRVHDYLVGVYDGLVHLTGAEAAAIGALAPLTSDQRACLADRAFASGVAELVARVPADGATLTPPQVRQTLMWLRKQELERAMGLGRAHALCVHVAPTTSCDFTSVGHDAECVAARPAERLRGIFEGLAELDRAQRLADARDDARPTPDTLALLAQLVPTARIHAGSSEAQPDIQRWVRDSYDTFTERLLAIEAEDARRRTVSRGDDGAVHPRVLGLDFQDTLAAVTVLARGLMARSPSSLGSWGSESLPPRGAYPVLHLFPYYAAADVTMGGLHFGWRPRLALGDTFHASAGLDVSVRSRDPLDRVVLLRPRLGLGATWFAAGSLRVPALEVDLGVIVDDVTRHPTESFGGELLVTLGTKLQLGVGLSRPVRSDTSLGDYFYLTLGVADLNGLVGAGLAAVLP